MVCSHNGRNIFLALQISDLVPGKISLEQFARCDFCCLPVLGSQLRQACWISRTLDELGTGGSSSLLLGALQHPLAKLIEACPTIGLALNQLQAMHMP
jgi:hypothetical protein